MHDKECYHYLIDNFGKIYEGKFKPTANEIIKEAESCDYGLESWRTLKTKADLIAAIKKEVIDDI